MIDFSLVVLLAAFANSLELIVVAYGFVRVVICISCPLSKCTKVPSGGWDEGRGRVYKYIKDPWMMVVMILV